LPTIFIYFRGNNIDFSSDFFCDFGDLFGCWFWWWIELFGSFGIVSVGIHGSSNVGVVV
jgi:hypothetical protein